MKHRKKRNWSQYNQRLKRIASVDFFISQEALDNWYYTGKRRPGGKIFYSDYIIEMCLVIREYFSLGLRQAEGFVESVMRLSGINLDTPDYTTLSRRCKTLQIILPVFKPKEVTVIAVDSTGLSVHSRREWNRLKHKKKDYKYQEEWRKLHILIDVSTGQILTENCTDSRTVDCQEMPGLIDSIDLDVSAVCGDMAYDMVQCRAAVFRKKARQLIPPIRRAKTTDENKEMRPYKNILKERDEDIKYIRANEINGDTSLARKSWKEKNGYHARSLIETTMSQIKSHCSDRLTNRTEETRKNQAMIKCKTVNYIIASMQNNH